MDTFQCKICNKVLGVKGLPRHLKTHNLDVQTYVSQHLDDFRAFGWTTCAVCGILTKGTTCSRECMGKWRSENFSGENHPWWNRKHSEESKEKNRQTTLHYYKTHDHPFLGKSHQEQAKKKMSETRKRLGLSKGKNNPMYGKTHTEEALRKIFDKRSMTKPEQLLKDILDDLSIEYTPQFFISEGGRTFSYDFYLPAYNMIIEVDGDYWHGGPGVDKHWYGVTDTIHTDSVKDAVATNRGHRILRVWESELKSDTQLIIDRLTQL